MQEYPVLPRRSRPRPPVTEGMPYMQIGVRPIPYLNAELFCRAYALSGVRNEPTRISVPGARALWLDERLPLAHPESLLFITGRNLRPEDILLTLERGQT